MARTRRGRIATAALLPLFAAGALGACGGDDEPLEGEPLGDPLEDGEIADEESSDADETEVGGDTADQ